VCTVFNVAGVYAGIISHGGIYSGTSGIVDIRGNIICGINVVELNVNWISSILLDI
jgi:hypothetical protein